jgi:mono/diheme cytochrome c family protein
VTGASPRETLSSNLARATRVAAALALVSSLAASSAVAAEPSATPAATDKLARGKYLVTIAGCNDCHTPFKQTPHGAEPDMTRMLSGHPEQIKVTAPAEPQKEPWLVSTVATNTAFSGPWGVSFTANLTPDVESGLGRWTFRNFKDTIRSGRHHGRGRQILPPMPIGMYKHMTDDDLEAVFTYLQTIPAIRNMVPEPLPPVMEAVAEGARQ